MKRFVLALVVAVALVACGPSFGSQAPASPKPTVGIRDGGPQAPKCAEKLAQAQGFAEGCRCRCLRLHDSRAPGGRARGVRRGRC